MRLFFLIAYVLICSIETISAQQQSSFSHNMLNMQSYNPGYVGTREAISITALYRNQWVGFEGAPTTQTLNIHAPMRRKNISVGLSLINDKIGPIRNQSISSDIAYKIRFNSENFLSIGIKMGATIQSNNVRNLQHNDNNDAVINIKNTSRTLLNIGTGFYYYSKKYYIGASITNLVRNDINNSTGHKQSRSSQVMHGWLVAGTYFDISHAIEFKPTTTLRILKNAPLQVELNGTFIFNQKLTAGLLYRSGDGIGALAGIYINPSLYVSYAYDYSIENKTGIYNQGTHELLMTYDLYNSPKIRIHSPRYF